MKQTEFLEKHIFNDLKNLNDGFDDETIHYFSESDFETVLERVAYFGIGLYSITPRLEGEPFEVATHNDFKKKATDARWYNKCFSDFKKRQSGLSYAATYKVSSKLLAR